MLSTVMKNLLSKPATRNYPAVARQDFDHIRGKVEIRIEDCIFCGLCVRKCPANCIDVQRTEATWEIDPFRCVVCGSCVEACPKKCLTMATARTATAYTKSTLTSRKAAEEQQSTAIPK